MPPKEKAAAADKKVTSPAKKNPLNRVRRRAGRPRELPSDMPPIASSFSEALTVWAGGGYIYEAVAKQIPVEWLCWTFPLEKRWAALQRVYKGGKKRFEPTDVLNLALLLSERYDLRMEYQPTADSGGIGAAISMLDVVEREINLRATMFTEDSELCLLCNDLLFMQDLPDVMPMRTAASHFFYGREEINIKGKRLSQGKALERLLEIVTTPSDINPEPFLRWPERVRKKGFMNKTEVLGLTKFVGELPYILK